MSIQLNKYQIITCLLCLLTMAAAPAFAAEPKLPYMDFPGPAPGAARGTVAGGKVTLENNVIRMVWDISGKHLVPTVLEDKLSGTVNKLESANSFNIGKADDKVTKGSAFTITNSEVKARRFAPVDPGHIRLANRFAGSAVELTLRCSDKSLEVVWKAILLDGTNYIRQEFTFKNLLDKEQMISHYYFLDQNGKDLKAQGTVAGSPVTGGNFFFGVESPFAFHELTDGRMSFWVKKTSALPAKAEYSHSTVTGVSAEGQMRRSFAYYISLERAHYYRQFNHFNGWYDDPFNYHEKRLKETVETLGNELQTKRGLPISSYVLDDGWDNANDPNTWYFNKHKTPNGFRPLLKLADKYDTGFGVWMSPFGGYGGRNERIKGAKTYGGESKVDKISGDRLMSLAGPNYYNRFKTAAVDLIENHGLNFMKVEFGMWDDYREQWQDDAEAVLAMVDTLRDKKPDFFVNASSGTYPSPFWLMTLESTWRAGGGDMPNLVRDFTGDHKREHWIGGRDHATYNRVIQRAPLYPVNSLMIHGIAIGQSFYPATYPNDITSIKHEVRSFYASGVTCSELYISHTLLTDEMYDVIAEAGKWAYSNRDILEDAHWIGGNPGEGEIYGRAGWNKRGAYIYLRNPTISKKSFTFDIADLFELPEGAPKKYRLKCPWADHADDAPIDVTAGSKYTLELEPHEVIVLDARAE